MTEAGTKISDKAGGAYRVLARKYRPSDFSGLIGQEPMVRTLTNAFNAGRIAQAWMLTGVRGVGKTTTARILARALNYKTDSIDKPTVDLSTEGEHCRAILEGRHVDVVEMDAASHTGIDDIRDIIDQARYAPVSARYKVFIIDEVHMLSNQAFNGLLKTLEEPPPHVKFIFATTEIRKVPITILSRCQRFDLRRIDAAMIKADLGRIGGLEGVEAEDEALAMIARASEGSMRDAQSIFDQAIAHSSGKVTAETVRDMLGLADRSRIIGLFDHLMKGDVAAALAEFRAQYDVGADPATVLNDLAEFNHLVTRLRFVPEGADDAALSEDERTRGLEFSTALSVRVLSRTWQMLLKGIQEVQSSGRPMAAGEMVLIRIAHAANLPTLDEALKRLDDLPAGTGSGQGQGQPPASAGGAPASNGGGGTMAAAIATQHAPVSGPGGGQTMRLVQPEPSSAPMQQAVVTEVAAPDAVPLKSLEDIAKLADAKRDMAFKVLLKRCVRLVSIEPGRLDISLTEDAPKTVMGDLTNRLKEWTGRRWIVSLSSEAGGPTLAEQEEGRRESAIADAKADPAVAAILNSFPGAKIIDIRIPDATDPDTVEEAADAMVPVDPDDDDDDDF
ncbi:DNA polymerase III subunit gamma/tau [Nitratireductor kimnyeongensis]|uniref:DNA polymerase III subunit gamma/tau n=1 Tax=Nitratireductor kimnyeongensis TaxID=430679 RepID=A0ABW0T6X2_9HYPH|nr:DNA polymerase III subunit gamma/tau [Nitratireductor kimnyeongensis]QZZ34141.1 DNA polymerase III subunit gamma/tau [Nitratireductor kimnyeongensis]